MAEMQMRTEGPIKTRREGAILEVTLDAPKANAISLKTSRVALWREATRPHTPIAMTSATSTVPKVFNYGSSTALP